MLPHNLTKACFLPTGFSSDQEKSNDRGITTHHRHFRAFCRDEDGAMTYLGLIVFLIMILVGGVGVDMMRYEMERTKLQNNLDVAVLAAASLSQDLPAEDVLYDYMETGGFIDHISGSSILENPFEKSVLASVQSVYDTMFMDMSGIETMSMNLSSAAIERIPSTEISVVLDISGSMGTNQRLERMQEASKKFVTESLKRNTNIDNTLINSYRTTINLVPFAGQVNPGTNVFEEMDGERFGTTTSENYFPEWQQDISNIVFWFDTTGDGEIDYSIKIEGYPDNDVELFNKDDLDTYYLYVLDYIAEQFPFLDGNLSFLGATIKGGKQPTTFYSATGEDVSGPTKFNQTDQTLYFNNFYSQVVPNTGSSCIELSYSDFLTTAWPEGTTEQTPHFVNWDFDEVSQNWGWCPENDMAIQYAQDDEYALHDFIDGLRLFDGTGTNYGMKYGLALLDPTTQTLFNDLSYTGEVPYEYASRPLQWTAEDNAKFIVLLTDGRTGSQVRPSDELETENKDTELTSRPDEDSTVQSSQDENIELFLKQCQLAKDKGVVVYTVALETSDIAAEEIKTCASSDSHFFEVTGTEVIDAFVSIASSIQRLRLVQ